MSDIQVRYLFNMNKLFINEEHSFEYDVFNMKTNSLFWGYCSCSARSSLLNNELFEECAKIYPGEFKFEFILSDSEAKFENVKFTEVHGNERRLMKMRSLNATVNDLNWLNEAELQNLQIEKWGFGKLIL